MPKPPDRVQLLKQESAAGGGDPNDLGELFYEDKINTREDAPEMQGVYLQSPSGPDDENVYITRDDSGNMLFKDENADASELSLSDLLSATGITETEHRNLDQLVHDIAEDSFEEVTYTGNKVTKLTVWTDAGKTVKIRETSVTYTGNQPTSIQTIQYDAAGVAMAGETMTETISYSGSQITSITRTLT